MKSVKFNKDEDILEQMRKAWAEHTKRLEEVPFLTDEELYGLYLKARSLPPIPPSELPPLPRRHTWKMQLRAAAMVAIVVLPLFVMPKAYACKMNFGADQKSVLTTLSEVRSALNG